MHDLDRWTPLILLTTIHNLGMLCKRMEKAQRTRCTTDRICI